MLLLPKRKVKHNLLKRVKHAFEWLLIPPIGLFLSALPALDAQNPANVREIYGILGNHEGTEIVTGE